MRRRVVRETLDQKREIAAGVAVLHRLVRVGRRVWIEQDIISREPQRTRFFDDEAAARAEWEKLPGFPVRECPAA